MADKKALTAVSIGSQNVAAAVFSETARGGLQLQSYRSAETPSEEVSPDEVKAALTSVVQGLKIKGRSVRYTITSQPVFIRFVKLPPLDVDQVDQIVGFEAQQNVPFPIDEVTWGYQLMGEDSGSEVNVVLAAVKSTDLDEIDQSVAAAGLRTEAVEVSAMAIYNAYRFNYSDLEGTTLLIDIGSKTTNLIYSSAKGVFVRTIKIGGADITKAIAKEFNISYDEAEQRKIADGFVALGGAYADHEDPVIAGVSKVIRNTLTRLHSEIMRTTNFYRSQQGGEAPAIGLLCGSSAALPFLREFFAEKLRIPIDYFNAFRNVTLASGVDRDAMSKLAHVSGELVGLALRDAGECPLQLDLVPESVVEEQALNKRKPYLYLAVAALTLLIGAAGFYFNQAAAIANAQTEALRSDVEELTLYDGKIQVWKDKLSDIEATKRPYTDAVYDRTYWVGLFNDLSRRMDSDLMWITMIEPMAEGQPVIEDLYELSELAPEAAAGAGKQGEEGKKMIDTLHIRGLYRENDGGPKVVSDYLDRLMKSKRFALEGIDTNDILIELEAGAGGSKYAWKWEMILPLPEGLQISFTK
ncbi:MAG: pilus assembly protein PilM [Verrucomicrobiales bacterium]|nr:pilus assembly protein PilM [Verrucomicrobiales bacterium]